MPAVSDRGASVSVVTDDGDLLDAGALAVREAVAKASAQIPDAGAGIGRGGRWAEPRIATADLLAFLDWNTWHRRCCVVKSQLIAGLGWRLERDDGSGAETVWDTATDAGDRGDPAVRLLLAPTPDDVTVTLDALLYRVMMDYHASGNGYLEVVRDARGRVRELYHVPARTVRRGVQRGAYWQVKAARPVPFTAFRHGGRGGTVRGSRSEIVHLMEYDPLSDDYGMPGWVGALATMGLDRTVLEFNTRLFQNSMMAHLAVVVEGGRLSEAGRAALKDFIRQRATGVENAGRVLLVEDENDRVKIRFEKLNLDIKDLMLKDIQQHFRDIVVAAHGVPPRVLGIATTGQLGATGEVEGQLRTFQEVVVRPVQRMVEATLGPVLDAAADTGAAGRGRYRLRFTGLDATGVQADAALLDVLFKHGVYAGADARALADRVVPGGTR